MFYCFMMMTTTKPGTMGCFSRGTLTSYEMKIVTGKTKSALVKSFAEQAKEWIVTHPDHELLGFTEERAATVSDFILKHGRTDYSLADFAQRKFTLTTPPETSCVITSQECWGNDFWSLACDIRELVKFPANPGDFDSNAIESQEAWEMLRGPRSESRNFWNRCGWELRYDIAETPGFLDEINGELSRIAHEPRLNDRLKYFKSIH